MRVWTLVPIVLLGACSTKKPETLESMRHELSQVQRYSGQMELNVVFPSRQGDKMTSTTKTQVTAALPERLRVDAQLEAVPGHPIHMVAVFDAAGMQAALHNGEQTQIIKITSAARLSPERPFDYGYPLTGVGLVPGTDLVGTMMHLSQAYHFAPPRHEEQNGVDVLVFSGERSFDEAFAEWAVDAPFAVMSAASLPDANDGRTPAELGAMMREQLRGIVEGMRRIELTVDPKTMLPTGYVIIDPKRSPSTVRFGAIDWHAEIAADAFAYPEGDAVDLTDKVIAQRKENELTPEVIERARQKLAP